MTGLTQSSQIVKFKGQGEGSLTISNQDRTIASLKSLIANLNQQVASITARVNGLSKKAQQAVQSKNTVSALAALRSRKTAESTLEQRINTLSQLEGLYDKIEQAVDQVTMVRVMEASTSVLRNLHAEVGGVTNVENVVERLKEEMDTVDEIGSVVESAGHGDAAIDESAIDDELEELLRHNQKEAETKEAQRTQQRLDNIGALDDKTVALQPSSQNPKIKSSQSADVDNFTVDAFDHLSLDERQPVNEETCQTQTGVAEALPKSIFEG